MIALACINNAIIKSLPVRTPFLSHHCHFTLLYFSLLARFCDGWRQGQGGGWAKTWTGIVRKNFDIDIDRNEPEIYRLNSGKGMVSITVSDDIESNDLETFLPL